jgi:UDP-glucose 4-epimerase
VILAWVVGSGGLLGSALCRSLRGGATEIFSPAARFTWNSEPELSAQMAAAVRAFADRAATADRWELYWAAGVGTMGSSSDAMALETRTLSLLLRLLDAATRLSSTPGAIAFASSAGAIYAGSPECLISEDTPAAPNTPYADEKLQQEELVGSFARAGACRTGLIARLSTIYGSGQASGKPQGLLTHVARCILVNRPIQIYVPFDTVRDYIAADDAAPAMVAALRAVTDPPGVLTRIIASEQPASIAQIIALFTRVARRNPRVISSATRLTGVYPRRWRFKSVAGPAAGLPPQTSLLVGLSQVLAAERAAFTRASGTGRE